MAKATVTLICTQCGAEFTRTKTCRNRKDADAWEAYMERVGGLCSECYRKQKQAEREEKLKALKEKYSDKGFPQIEGVSDKQIKYAEDLRIKFVDELYNGRGALGYKQDMEAWERIKTATSAREIIDLLSRLVY